MYVFKRDGQEVAAQEWPVWSQPTGAHDAYSAGDRVSHNGKHWTSNADGNVWEPGVYGWTQDDPIPAERGMEYVYGLYYLDSEDGKLYLCQRTGDAAGGTVVLQYLPHELVGHYFVEVG